MRSFFFFRHDLADLISLSLLSGQSFKIKMERLAAMQPNTNSKSDPHAALYSKPIAFSFTWLHSSEPVV